MLTLDQVGLTVETRTVLKDVSFTLAPHEWLALAGPSGSGKSTILKLMALMRSPSSGRILYQGADILTLDASAYRREVAYCTQSPVLFGRTVLDNLRFPADIRREAFDQARAKALLSHLGLPGATLGQPIDALSGGEKQRVALLRHAMYLPRIMLLDEVTSALDVESKACVLAWLQGLYVNDGVTLVMVSHDAADLQDATRTLHLAHGQIKKGADHATA